jgi:hypothetical protein
LLKLSGMGEMGNKREWWRGWIQLWYNVRNYVSVTMYTQYNIKKNKIKQVAKANKKCLYYQKQKEKVG